MSTSLDFAALGRGQNNRGGDEEDGARTEGEGAESGPSRPQFQRSMLLQKLPGYMEGDSMDRLGASMADVSFATQGVCVCLRIWLVGVCVLLVM